MKTILVFCFAFVITTSAAAQKYYGHPYYHPRAHTYVGIGLGFPYYSYPPFYYPYYYGSPFYTRPTKLEREIADIKSDYQDKIWSARHDKSLTHSERKSEVHRLKAERDTALRDAEYNYHKKKNNVNDSTKPEKNE